MKSSRALFLLSAGACGALSLALAIALGGYFRSVEAGGSGLLTEKRLLSHLQQFQERLKAASTPEEARAALKALEIVDGFGRDSDGARELKKASGPAIAVFAAKPRESEPRYALTKKREVMEALVNAYRKEIPNGDIRLRAAYLNVLFDAQQSLLNETDEAEQVFLKRSRERLDALRPIVASRSDISARVAAIDSIFQSYERGFNESIKWRADKGEALAKLEKALPALARDVYQAADSGVDDTRRTFLYVCFLSLVIAASTFLALYLGYKVIRVRADVKMDTFLAFLRSFGSERPDPQLEASMKALHSDEDWAQAVIEAKRAEEGFLRSCHTLLAIPRSLRSPCVVVGKDRTVKHWNESAAAAFGLSSGKEWSTEDFLTTSRLKPRDGEPETLIEMIRSAEGGLAEARFELLVKQDTTWQPYELTLSPIATGPLVGGKVLFWREIGDEAERVNRSVTAQLERTRDMLHKITHHYPVELMPNVNDVPAVQAMIEDLSAFKARGEERELLWKTEAQALADQVNRQQEILTRLNAELSELRARHSEALSIVARLHDGEEAWHDEVCLAERDLERFVVNRQRLLHDLRHQGVTLEKARKFEEQLRTATAEAKAELESYAAELDELNQFAEAARVHSVNLSLVRDPGYWEYASRSRAFAHELARFTEKAATLGTKVREFLAAHPGGALAAHLNGPGVENDLLEGIREEQERLVQMLKRWKENGEALVGGSERAVQVLQDIDKKGAVATQLGETSLLISEQSRGNLERWS